MERAEILTTLRGDHASSTKVTTYHDDTEKNREQKRVRFEERFPPSFATTAPENVKNIILWCLERDPSKRPSAEELLSVCYTLRPSRMPISLLLQYCDAWLTE
jgi:serine/threonine protein kinase